METIIVPTVPMCLRMSPAGTFSNAGAANWAPITPPESASSGVPGCPRPSFAVHSFMSCGNIAMISVMPITAIASAAIYPFRFAGTGMKLRTRQIIRNAAIG